LLFDHPVPLAQLHRGHSERARLRRRVLKDHHWLVIRLLLPSRVHCRLRLLILLVLHGDRMLDLGVEARRLIRTQRVLLLCGCGHVLRQLLLMQVLLLLRWV